jgi:DNA-directed RNA polymerase, subunit A'' (EC 2.7.7.6)
VKVSSGAGDGIDVDAIADRVLESEFGSDDEKERFLGERAPPTNLSEHAGPGLNKADELGVESDD